MLKTYQFKTQCEGDIHSSVVEVIKLDHYVSFVIVRINVLVVFLSITDMTL